MALPACPICGDPAAPEHAPFCSARHRDRDLLQWLEEGYRLPAGPGDDGDEQDGVDKPGARD